MNRRSVERAGLEPRGPCNHAGPYAMIVPIHTAVGLIALVARAWNLAATKGSRGHHIVGWAYAGSMATLLLTSFAIFELLVASGLFM